MSILIEGMEMPISCGDCPCGSVFSGYKCMAKQKNFEKYPLDSRQDWCPLVSVQPHGRLIDADALLSLDRQIYDGGMAVGRREYIFSFEVEDAPTVIEAEEGE